MPKITCPSCGLEFEHKITRKMSVGELKFRDHVNDAYKKHGKYPWGGVHVKALNRVCSLYDYAELMALWDIFFAKNWSWNTPDGRTIKVPHDLLQFEKRITILLEDEHYKVLANKYREVKFEIVGGDILKEVPKPVLTQGNITLEQAKRLQELSHGKD